MSITLQQKWNLNSLYQWEQYFDNMGPVGPKLMTVRCDHPGYVAFGPLPVDPVNTRHWNPYGDWYYQKPFFYDPLGKLQTVPKVSAMQPMTCARYARYTGACKS